MIDFAEKLQLDRLFGRSHRHANSDLARALGHRNQHHVHDADSTDDQRNGCDRD